MEQRNAKLRLLATSNTNATTSSTTGAVNGGQCRPPKRPPLNRIPLRSFKCKENEGKVAGAVRKIQLSEMEQVASDAGRSAFSNLENMGECKQHKEHDKRRNARNAVAGMKMKISSKTSNANTKVTMALKRRRSNILRATIHSRQIRSNAKRRALAGRQDESSQHDDGIESGDENFIILHRDRFAIAAPKRRNLFPVVYADEIDQFSCRSLSFDIFELLRFEEKRYLLANIEQVSEALLLNDGSRHNHNYNYSNGEIRPQMRSFVLEWLVKTHSLFHMLPETLHLAVQIINRLLKSMRVKHNLLLLIGLGALFVASKLEDTFLPSVCDLLKVSRGSYKEQDLLSMEEYICKTLRFDLSGPTSLQFLRRLSKIARMSDRKHCFAKFILELSFFDCHITKWRPSMLAAASLYLTMIIYEDRPSWSEILEFHSSYSLNKILEQTRYLADILIQSSTQIFQCVSDKYQKDSHYFVSRLDPRQRQRLNRWLADGHM